VKANFEDGETAMTGTMNASRKSRIETLQGWMHSWWSERKEISRELREIELMGDEGVKAIARDCGIEPRSLAELIRLGPNAADELPLLMKALNIDPDAVHFEEPSLYRNLRQSCALCVEKDACQHALKDGTASEEYQHFCHNADTLSELRARPEFQAN
jgi:hypothetical protein